MKANHQNRGDDRSLVIALVSGLLFALGLGLSGMTNPAKVLNFLDVFGAWDPSLAFVMAGAIAVYLPVYRLLKGRSRPLLADRFHWPTKSDIDRDLVVGSILFGIGWGIAGLCPGPAVVSLATGEGPILAFGVAMLLGMLAQRQLMRRRSQRASEQTKAAAAAPEADELTDCGCP